MHANTNARQKAEYHFTHLDPSSILIPITEIMEKNNVYSIESVQYSIETVEDDFKGKCGIQDPRSFPMKRCASECHI